MSISLLFGGLALTVMTTKQEKDDVQDCGETGLLE